MIEVRHLRSLAAIADTRKISTAAARVHLTQSALSHQVRAVEAHYGVTLFERGRDGARFTQAGERVLALARPPLSPSQSRCRHHVEAALAALTRAHEHVRENDPPELLALALREALDQVGEMAGAVYTNDLLDRIFSRFCIGK